MKKRKGYTLIELTTVLIALSILTAIGWSYVDDSANMAKYTKAEEDITLLAQAVSLYKFENEKYPNSLDDLTEKSKYNNVPYIMPQAMPKKDPWGLTSTGIGGNLPYAYSYDDTGFAIWSFGKNRHNDSGGGGSLPSKFAGDDTGKFGQN